jgi:nitrite reductase/ring-hydroxylating ferredoxin subunit/uncharacterized membrane protein
MRNSVIDLITSSRWIGRTADVLGDAVRQGYAAFGPGGLRTKSALNGTWLGHPLHAALTDVPLGAWTAAVALDAAGTASGGDDFDRGAGVAIGVGLAGAVVAALAGVTDWSDTDGRARRIGLVHGLLNLTGAGLFGASLVMRREETGAGARLAALAGYGVALAAAYLGGALVYGERVGVDHAAGLEVPEAFTPVLASQELADRQMKRVTVGSTPVLLARRNGTVRAIAETCSHLGGPLSEGTLEDEGVVCPWHGSCFALDDGHVVNGPATHPQPCYEARERDGQIEIRMPQARDTRGEVTEAQRTVRILVGAE